ncbi:hypothetical protein GJR98_03690 [Haloferax sp. MBLA0077]|uniref:DUF8052 domain-containing protein n=2 Tax=Haloferax TaxID=2251 RepID=A0A6G1Z0L2_9EURY|nr:hypothetical protein Hfx1149_03710 [Haloferax sp. CBA1149]MRW79824.1 hypothetical protein [Haloferax marinisediminis]
MDRPGSGEGRPDSDGPATDVPDWEDEYLDRVSDRLMYNYDLEKDHRVDGESFDLFGTMHIETQKQFLHRSINFANHYMDEYLLARRTSRATLAEVERLVDLADTLSEEWIDGSEEHQGTEFTFVLVAPDITDDVRSFVNRFSRRKLLKYGYHGHYEVHLVVVAPDDEDVVASEHADVARAFTLWQDSSLEPTPGLLTRVLRRLSR